MVKLVKKTALKESANTDAEILAAMEEVNGIKRDRGEVVTYKEEGLEGILKTEGDDIIPIYDRETGQKSLTLKYMLPTQLRKKRDGKPVFTIHDPKITPKTGAFTCLLHKDRDERKHFDELGLPVCRKANLISIFHVNRHMQKKHPAEYATIREEIERKDKDEEMALRHATRNQLTLRKIRSLLEPPAFALLVVRVAERDDTGEPPILRTDNRPLGVFPAETRFDALETRVSLGKLLECVQHQSSLLMPFFTASLSYGGTVSTPFVTLASKRLMEGSSSLVPGRERSNTS